MSGVIFKKPVNNLKPQAGRLLIAEPFLGDPNFSRSVIFLCEHSDSGSIGFILNHSTDLMIGDLLPDLNAPDLSIYQGGPVQVDTLHVLHTMPALLGGNKITDKIYWGGTYEALHDTIAYNTYQPDHLRLFVGYSGWSPGQLEDELKEGSWIVTEMSEKLLFETAPKDIWKQAILTLGKEYAYIAGMPVNPQLN